MLKAETVEQAGAGYQGDGGEVAVGIAEEDGDLVLVLEREKLDGLHLVPSLELPDGVLIGEDLPLYGDVAADEILHLLLEEGHLSRGDILAVPQGVEVSVAQGCPMMRPRPIIVVRHGEGEPTPSE